MILSHRQGLQNITDYRTITSISSTDSLPDDLNTFYTHFETSSHTTERGHLTHQPSHQARYTVLRNINPCKAARPDNIPADKLADVLTSIYNLSLSDSTIPSSFKTTSIVPFPKKSPPTCLNDYKPVAPTPTFIKCFERVVLTHIQSSIPDTLDHLQYA